MPQSPLQIKFEAHLKDYEQDKAFFDYEIKTIKKILESKVSYRHYTWTMGVLAMILMSMFGYIALRIDTLTQTGASTQQDVSFLKGKLAPYNVQYKN